MKRTQIQLPEEMWQRLRQEAFDKNISTAELLRQIVEQYWERNGSEDDYQGHALPDNQTR